MKKIFFLIFIFSLISCGSKNKGKLDEKLAQTICESINQSDHDFKPQELRDIRELTIDVSKSDLQYLIYLPNLEKLDIHLPYEHRNNSQQLLHNLKELQQLKVLNLEGVNDKDLKHIKNLSYLKTLGIESVYLTDAGFYHLRKLVNLKELYIYSYEATGSGLYFLKNLKNLEKFYFRGKLFSNIGIKYLSQFSDLKEIYFEKDSEGNGPKFHPSEIKQLKKLTKLKSLTLANSIYREDFSNAIKEFENLEELSFSTVAPGLSKIYNFSFLKKLSKLKKIRLGSGIKLKNGDIKYFRNLKQNVELDLRGVEIDKLSKKKLEIYLPKAKIIYVHQ